MGDILCAGLLADSLWIKLHGVVVWVYETIFNSKYLINNNKITALCSRNRLAVLTCIYIQNHTQVTLLERGNDRHTHP